MDCCRIWNVKIIWIKLILVKWYRTSKWIILTPTLFVIVPLFGALHTAATKEERMKDSYSALRTHIQIRFSEVQQDTLIHIWYECLPKATLSPLAGCSLEQKHRQRMLPFFCWDESNSGTSFANVYRNNNLALA